MLPSLIEEMTEDQDLDKIRLLDERIKSWESQFFQTCKNLWTLVALAFSGAGWQTPW